MPGAQDHELIETFLANRAHEALGDGIGVRRVQWHVKDFDADRLKDGIKASGEHGLVGARAV
jgi:hypothetical protein